MKPVKTYEEYYQNLVKAGELNEKLMDAVKGAIRKVGEFFAGNGSSFLNALVKQAMKLRGKLSSENKFPNGVTFYPSKFDVDILKKNGVEVSMPKTRVKESYDLNASFEREELNEALESPTLPNVNTDELKDWIESTITSKDRGTPLLIWGAAGIAKTALTVEVTKKLGLRLIDFDLMTMNYEDFFLPTVKPSKEIDDHRATRLPDEFLPMYRQDDPNGNATANGPDGKGGVMFFDEIARCHKRVQNVCLKLLNERRLGSWILGDKWTIIACANRHNDEEDQSTYSWTTTLSNRVMMVNFVPTAEEWEHYMTTHPDVLSETDPEIRTEILGFVKFFKDKHFHAKSTIEGETAWPSPRSWKNATVKLSQWKEYYTAKGKAFPEKMFLQTLEASVGKAAAQEFMGFRALIKKVDVKDIPKVFTDGKNGPKWSDNITPDELNALITVVLLRKTGQVMTDSELENLCDWLISQKKVRITGSGGVAGYVGKILAIVKELHPYTQEANSKWFVDCKNKLMDTYFS